MTDILQQIMSMIENTRSVSAISSVSMIGFAVLFVFGAVNCILGYRLLRFWMMLCGFAIGAGVGFGVAYSSGITETYMYAAIMVGIGAVVAIVAFVSYKIGIFILGAGIGIGLGIYVFHPTTSLVFFFCLLLGVGLGVLAMRQAREVLIVGTSLLGGAMAGFSAAKLGGLADIPYGAGMSVGFALLGMLVQFATNRHKTEEDEEYDDEDIHGDAEESSDYIDFRDYMPQKADRKAQKETKKTKTQVRKQKTTLSTGTSPRKKDSGKNSRREQPVDFRIEKNKTRKNRMDDVAPESEKTIPYRPRKSRQKEIDLPLGSFDYEDSYIPEEDTYEEPVMIDEDELDEEVLREMMEEDDREGEELWKKISRRDDTRKKRKKKK
ncbi:TM7S3/TM198-like domain-containing protein [Blautia sp. MSJ-19]|uniref:TM7S3/TM198-like domain-containing protein n=1 Tax=Blautia sp. MSJ-19 TaxID=2841517 RepID=UPI001C0EE9CA|nr:DUF4203 domain-containing protein [Blautia sp. MSJ-19]MBU5482336.1 DUF4203 domain-containing protein [Blautia sp. MSJ-19]